MNKGKVVRLAGFVGALGLSTVLVTTAIQGTGAYFSDSQDGSLQATSGSLRITAGGQNISLAGLNPGDFKETPVTVQNSGNSTTSSDIWLVFDPTTAAYGEFTGASGSAVTSTTYQGFTDGGMGQYGHFEVHAPAGNFVSYNLKLAKPSDATGGFTNPGNYADTNTKNECFVDQWGHGGSTAQHHAEDNTPATQNDIAYCGVPAQILLAQNVAPGSSITTNVGFGLTEKQEAQNQLNDPNVPFKIVATQPGVFPGQAWGVK